MRTQVQRGMLLAHTGAEGHASSTAAVDARPDRRDARDTGGGAPRYQRGASGAAAYEHGNDSFFYRAVEPDSLIAILWHFSRFANSVLLAE